MRHLVTALAAGSVLTAATAWADSHEPASLAYPMPERGMAAECTNGSTMTIVDVNADGSVFLIKEEHPEWGETLIRYAYGLGRLSMHWEDEAGMPEAVLRGLDQEVFASFWPLTPGFTAHYEMTELESDGDQESITADARVLEPQTMATPMGEVTAWGVQLEHAVDGSPDRRSIYTLWYMEGLPLPIRVETQFDVDGEALGGDSYEIVSYTLPE